MIGIGSGELSTYVAFITVTIILIKTLAVRFSEHNSMLISKFRSEDGCALEEPIVHRSKT